MLQILLKDKKIIINALNYRDANVTNVRKSINGIKYGINVCSQSTDDGINVTTNGRKSYDVINVRISYAINAITNG